MLRLAAMALYPSMVIFTAGPWVCEWRILHQDSAWQRQVWSAGLGVIFMGGIKRRRLGLFGRILGKKMVHLIVNHGLRI